MTSTASAVRGPVRLLAWAWMAGTLLMALGGCASAPPGDVGSARDIMTESDEPEARKRARIRMELAVGYFEQGQTNVALDELKQVRLSHAGDRSPLALANREIGALPPQARLKDAIELMNRSRVSGRRLSA